MASGNHCYRRIKNIEKLPFQVNIYPNNEQADNERRSVVAVTLQARREILF